MGVIACYSKETDKLNLWRREIMEKTIMHIPLEGKYRWETNRELEGYNMINSYQIIDEKTWKRAMHCMVFETVLNLLSV